MVLETDQLTTAKIVEYVRSLITSDARVVGGRIPEVPNRIIAVQMGAGPGLAMEGLFDTMTFQVTCRGAENNLSDAETMALEVDGILTGRDSRLKVKSENFMIDNVYVSQCTRSGGSPSQLSMIDSQSRYTFTCNYIVQIATNIGV